MKFIYTMVWAIGLCSYCVSLEASEIYAAAQLNANAERVRLLAEYETANTKRQHSQVISRAASRFHTLFVNEMAPPWYGTQWDYNGTTTTPGVGKIACGYFVTTLLRDTGVNLERVRLAQQASELIIKTLVTEQSIRRFSDSTMNDFVENINAWGNGLYLVGLDNHVGFLSVDDEGFYFIHSSFVVPSYVIKEDAATSSVLASSRYKIVGKLDDSLFIHKWLNDETFKL